MWNRSRNLCSRSLSRLNNLLGALVDKVVVVCLESDSDFSLCCHCLRLLNDWRALLLFFHRLRVFHRFPFKKPENDISGCEESRCNYCCLKRRCEGNAPRAAVRPVSPGFKSDILRRNSPSQRTATFCIIAYQQIVFRAYLPHFPQSCLIMIPHKSLYCKGFRNIFSKTCVMKISTLYMDILVKLQTRKRDIK